MSWIDRTLPAERSLEDLKYFLQIALLTFFGYLVAAELAFFVGTLSDKIFAPFWPPNIVLLFALLIARRGWRWIAILAAFPAHVIAETRIGMSLSELLVAFATQSGSCSAQRRGHSKSDRSATMVFHFSIDCKLHFHRGFRLPCHCRVWRRVRPGPGWRWS